MEITPPVKQTHTDYRQRLIRRLLQQIAGQHPESSRVHRQGPVHTELGTQERDRPLTEVAPGGASEVGVERFGDGIEAGEVVVIERRLEQ